LSGGRELLLQNEGVYEKLMLYESSNAELEIVRDLSRTYPSHVYYQQRQVGLTHGGSCQRAGVSIATQHAVP
jgi:hypothetical protein